MTQPQTGRPEGWEPSTHDNSIVSFWSKPIRDRLAQSTLSAGQAAKRDLARYHDMIDRAMPELHPENAAEVVAIVRGETGGTVPDFAAHVPLGRLALLDAADRAIAELARDPQANLADVVRRHFRLTPEGI